MYLPATAGNFLAPNSRAFPIQRARMSSPNGARMRRLRASRTSTQTRTSCPPFWPTASPLRTTHLRDPEGPATTFAAESFMDEIAAAAGADPVEFRSSTWMTSAKAVLTKAAEKSGWDQRPRRKSTPPQEIATGRGVALALRGGTRVATIAEVEVNRRTGAVRVKRFVCVHDCGLIINPEALRGTIAANLMQSLSRSLKEEVMFDRSHVTSVDWATYPVARASDVPDRWTSC